MENKNELISTTPKFIKIFAHLFTQVALANILNSIINDGSKFDDAFAIGICIIICIASIFFYLVFSLIYRLNSKTKSSKFYSKMLWITPIFWIVLTILKMIAI
jgi:hypothetical protein